MYEIMLEAEFSSADKRNDAANFFEKGIAFCFDTPDKYGMTLSAGMEFESNEELMKVLASIVHDLEVDKMLSCWYYAPEDKTDASIIFTNEIGEEEITFAGIDIDEFPEDVKKALWYSIAEPEHELGTDCATVEELCDYIPEEFDNHMFAAIEIESLEQGE